VLNLGARDHDSSRRGVAALSGDHPPKKWLVLGDND